MTFRRINIFGRLTLLALLASLGGCVYTSATSVPKDESKVVARPAKDASTVLITEGELKDRPHKVIGMVSATARPINLVTAAPTREDANAALRLEAAKLGADAVITVRYRSEAVGVGIRNKITAEGFAVTFE